MVGRDFPLVYYRSVKINPVKTSIGFPKQKHNPKPGDLTGKRRILISTR